jgi:hypothetical protein
MSDLTRSRIRTSKLPRLMMWMQAAVLVLTLLAGEAGVTLGQDLGTWELVVPNAGIAAMHAAVTRYGTVVLLDRTNIGASQIALPGTTTLFSEGGHPQNLHKKTYEH